MSEEKRLLLVGCGGKQFIGHTELTDAELIKGQYESSRAVSLKGFRQFLTVEVPTQSGNGLVIRQINQIIPLSACEGPIDVMAVPDYWMWLDTDKRALKKVRELLEQVTHMEIKNRAEESGIILTGNNGKAL